MLSQNNETAAMLVSQARWLKTRAAIELWMQREAIVMCVKRLSMVVPKQLKLSGILFGSIFRGWKCFELIMKQLLYFEPRAVLARSVERWNAVREVVGLNPGAASIFGLLK